MANSLSTQITFTSTVDGVRTVLSSNNNANTTSSNFIAGTQQVTSSAWTQLSLGSLTDVLGLTVINDNTVNTASTITVGSGSSGQNILAILTPASQANIPWSGSLAGLYAKVVGSYGVAGNAVINGTVQWSAQQS